MITPVGRLLLAQHLAATTPSARPQPGRSWLLSTVVFVVVGAVILWRGCK
jgi:hypothetical protein